MVVYRAGVLALVICVVATAGVTCVPVGCYFGAGGLARCCAACGERRKRAAVRRMVAPAAAGAAATVASADRAVQPALHWYGVAGDMGNKKNDVEAVVL